MRHKTKYGSPTAVIMTDVCTTFVQRSKIVNNRHRFGKDAFGGRPDLEAKRKVNQQANTRKTTMLPVDENDDFFSDTKKDRKPRRGNTSNGGRNAV